jgi:hypothetical protein
MKTTFVFVLAVAMGFAAGYVIISKQNAGQLARQKAVWEAEKANLEAELDSARQEARLASRPVITQPADAPAAVPASVRSTPAEIVARLQTLARVNSPQDLRQAVYPRQSRRFATFWRRTKISIWTRRAWRW